MAECRSPVARQRLHDHARQAGRSRILGRRRHEDIDLDGQGRQRDAVAAFARLRTGTHGVRLVLLGGGAGYERTEARELRRLAAALGVDERITIGSARPDEMPAAMASAALVVVATRLYEGFGLPAAEAAAAGRAVVATRVGALSEVVVDRSTGLLIPPAEPDALAGAIAELLENDALRERLGSTARVRARAEFTLERSVGAYADAYRAVLRLDRVAAP
ncbi:MAG: glycosyltransferase [Chloroflexi bacterium]|nr:glycosyltransferase [Chloroflexota bacterium]